MPRATTPRWRVLEALATMSAPTVGSDSTLSDDFGIDLDDVNRVIDSAEVLIIRLETVGNRVLVDFRSDAENQPFISRVPRVSSIEERVAGDQGDAARLSLPGQADVVRLAAPRERDRGVRGLGPGTGADGGDRRRRGRATAPDASSRN